MDIGGVDILFECEMTPERLRKVLSTIRCWWPEARFEEDKAGQLNGKTPLAVPSTIFVYKTQRVFEEVREEGVTEALEDVFMSLYVEPARTTFVIGKEGGETDLIRQDIEQMIQEG